MKPLLLLILINYSLSLVVFPFKIKENEAEKYKSPINQTKINMDKYLYHILNNYEFISEIEVGTPKQKVELIFDYDDDYLTLLGHSTSINPYFYNLSSSYQELMSNDPKCNLKVFNSHTIKEILYLKNKFFSNLDDFISSKDEISHEFIIIFSKMTPKINELPGPNKYSTSNAFEIGILVNTKYKNEHGIYKPFLKELIDNKYIESQLHFLYYFDKYKGNLYDVNNNNNNIYEGLFVFGKHPHELLPEKYDIKNLYWTDTFLIHSEYSDYENIEWGFKFDQICLDYGNGKKENFDILRSVFDLNVEYILPPFQFYQDIKSFFDPLRDICFTETNARNFDGDSNIYRMIYCNYEEFGKNYLKTFPKLVFKMNDFHEEFEFTYKDLFKPVYDNKYYLFLIFIKKEPRPSEIGKEIPTWFLGRIFFKKYQFVFDALNKTIGYYKINNKEEDIETDTNTDTKEKTDDVTDTTKEEKNKEKEEKEKEVEKYRETDYNNENNNEKESDIIIDNNSDNNDDSKNSKENDSFKENKINDILLIIIFSIVLGIILITIIILCYKWLCDKNKRKKRTNELIDDTEYNPETAEEEKIIN